ncbi:ABC-type Fe3+/spermidine/putrescine transport system ATPase subunit [Catalinimonas alkaloidigena]|nr:hypothetical protein [Catalinimonas alkaloidigena]MDF9799061.1 ABC-type Fe3+/spermidine/putrescine transport system ATPase subunit [Catalinimonas alkaloidigena]
MNRYIIEVRERSKFFDGKPTVDHVSLQFDEGQTIVLLGTCR